MNSVDSAGGQRINDERPTRFIVHISDTHFVAPDDLLYGAVRPQENLRRALAQLEGAEFRPDAILISGDLADAGLPEAYAALRAELEPAAARLGAPIIWMMGNHDSRSAFRRALLGGESGDGPSGEPGGEPTEAASDIEGMPVDARASAPIHEVIWLGGLRVITLDTTVPGFHHGELDDEQLAWLDAQLGYPAPEGTIIAMHHPPMPDPVYALAEIELRGQERLAAVLRGRDVRCILAGHAHYASSTTFAGIPLSVASATCYTNSVVEHPGVTRGVDGAQSINLVHVYEEQVVHTIMPIDTYPTLYETSVEVMRLFNRLTPEQQRAVLALTPEERAAYAAVMLEG